MLIEREDNQIKHNVINIEIAKDLRGKKKKKKMIVIYTAKFQENAKLMSKFSGESCMCFFLHALNLTCTNLKNANILIPN